MDLCKMEGRSGYLDTLSASGSGPVPDGLLLGSMDPMVYSESPLDMENPIIPPLWSGTGILWDPPRSLKGPGSRLTGFHPISGPPNPTPEGRKWPKMAISRGTPKMTPFRTPFGTPPDPIWHSVDTPKGLSLYIIPSGGVHGYLWVPQIRPQI